MNSRELVRRTLDFENVPRVARTFGDSDFVHAGHGVKTRATEWKEVGGGRWEMTDMWGNLWGRIDRTSKGEVVEGVLKDYSDLDAYEFPDFSNPADYEPVRKKRAERGDKWLICGLPGFAFSVARKMRKLDQYLMDVLLEPDFLHELHDRIDALLADMIRNYAAAGADCVMFGEDWGTQTQLLMNPRDFRREFLPRFANLCSLAHDCGIRVFMHSCGQIEEVVPWLIDAGIDLFQFDQPELHGIDVLASHQARAGKITYMCPVDIQRTLQTGDERKVRAAARLLLDKLWKGRGGFVADRYGDDPSIGLDPKVQDWACDEFVRHGQSKV